MSGPHDYFDGLDMPEGHVEGVWLGATFIAFAAVGVVAVALKHLDLNSMSPTIAAERWPGNSSKSTAGDGIPTAQRPDGSVRSRSQKADDQGCQF